MKLPDASQGATKPRVPAMGNVARESELQVPPHWSIGDHSAGTLEKCRRKASAATRQDVGGNVTRIRPSITRLDYVLRLLGHPGRPLRLRLPTIIHRFPLALLGWNSQHESSKQERKTHIHDSDIDALDHVLFLSLRLISGEVKL